MEKVFNKLVRDNIPNIIDNNDEIAITRILSNEEYRIIQDQIYLSDFDKYINELEKLDTSDKNEV
ncbi:MAG: hypothetical protein IJY25_04360 [Bacilli bacterium]|nr:hypothetical protein [Bacilli bacterium]